MAAEAGSEPTTAGEIDFPARQLSGCPMTPRDFSTLGLTDAWACPMPFAASQRRFIRPSSTLRETTGLLIWHRRVEGGWASLWTVAGGASDPDVRDDQVLQLRWTVSLALKIRCENRFEAVRACTDAPRLSPERPGRTRWRSQGSTRADWSRQRLSTPVTICRFLIAQQKQFEVSQWDGSTKV
eukprot:s4215_g8.t1